MNAIVHVITDTSVTVINTEDGTTVKYFEGDKRYLDTLNFIRDGCPEHAFGHLH